MTEVELDGDPMEIQCPRCDGDGTITSVEYYAEASDMWVTITIDHPIDCSLCGGTGRIPDVPVHGIVEVSP